MVKVLDFGLAKALEPAAMIDRGVTTSPTITSPALTEMGIILGTAAYMSPEQAKGRAADKRSDIWAFGCVLYEMLSCQRAFKGDDVSETLAAVLRQDVDWPALPLSTPASVRRLMARCLDRDARRRLRDIGEARIVLDDPAAAPIGDTGAVAALALPRPLWRRAMPVVLAVVLTGVLTTTVAWYLSPQPSPALGVTRLSFTLPPEQSFPINTPSNLVAISPDGSQIVYTAGSQQLFLRSMSQQDVKAVPGTERYGAMFSPVFSPDGRSLAFYALSDRTLKRIAITGGAAVTICPAGQNPQSISWGPDGIVFAQYGTGILRVSEKGGTPAVIVPIKDGEAAQGPQLLPGGHHVLFTMATDTTPDRWDKANIVVQSLTSGERKTLIEGGSDARYLPTGYLVYALGGGLYAVAFDIRQLAVVSAPVPILTGVRRADGNGGGAHFSVSSTGSLIYIPGPVSTSMGLRDIALSDLEGKVERLKLPPGPYRMPRASPDGTRIAFWTDDGKEASVWTFDLSHPARSRLTLGGGNRFPIWSADGKHVAFQSDREGDLAIFWQPVDGTGNAERLTKPDQGTSHVPESWSPKGDRFLFSVTKGSDMSLWTFSLQDKSVTPFGGVHSSTPIGAVFSPDGRWVAYTSSDRGSTTIYVQPFPATGAKYQLAANENNSPHEVVWSPDGKELFYNPRPTGFEAVSVTTEPTFAFGNPVAVPRPFPLGPPAVRRAYDMTSGDKFLVLMPAGQTEAATLTAPHIEVVLNWFEELKARVPTR